MTTAAPENLRKISVPYLNLKSTLDSQSCGVLCGTFWGSFYLFLLLHDMKEKRKERNSPKLNQTLSK